MAFPELLPEFEPHKVRQVYVMQWQNPQLVLDISDVIDVKLRALACHASQFADFKNVEARVRQRSGEIGQAQGFAHAEGFDHIVLPF
jgi:LmbE family N-acetylglucosaminyl deacetylase